MSSPDIFGQLASQDSANQQHDQAASQQNGSGDVFSQIAANGGNVPVAQTSDTTGQVKNDVGATVIVPKEGEDFSDTINRAIQRNKEHPQDVQADVAKETTAKNIASKTSQTLAAAPLIGAAGAAAITGASEAGGLAIKAGKAALKPITDAIVEELPYFKSSPSLYLEHAAKQVVNWVAQNPDKALGLVSKSALVGAAVKWLMSNGSHE